MTKHSEYAFVPKCIPAKGKPWLVQEALRRQAKDARDAFINLCHGPATPPPDSWKALKIEGWRIVKVRVSEI